MTDVVLPTKLSALIRLAREDLRKVEKNPLYRVGMHYWHAPKRNADDRMVCVVCLAGAVMAGTLGAPPACNMSPDDYPMDVAEVLFALNDLRYAQNSDAMAEACRSLGAKPIPWDEYVPDYSVDPEGFHAVLGRLADAFEDSGQ